MAEIIGDLLGPQSDFHRIRQLAYDLGDEMGNISNTQFNTNNTLQTTSQGLTAAMQQMNEKIDTAVQQMNGKVDAVLQRINTFETR